MAKFPWKREKKLSSYEMPADKQPICPHCEKPTDGLMSRQLEHDVGKVFVWTCPRCLKILGVGHRSSHVWTN